MVVLRKEGTKTSITLRGIRTVILCIISFTIGFSFVFTYQSLSSTNGGTQPLIDLNLFTSNQDDNNADFQLAYDQSFGFFDDIPKTKWNIHQQIHAEYNKHKNPDNPREWVPGHSTFKASWFNSARAFYQGNYEPNFTCEFERRIGGNGNGDGPKWVSAMYIKLPIKFYYTLYSN